MVGTGGSEALPFSKRVLVDAQGFDLRLERRAGNAELRGCPDRTADPSVRRRERGFDQRFLAIGERGHVARHVVGALARFPLVPRLVVASRLALATDSRAA